MRLVLCVLVLIAVVLPGMAHKKQHPYSAAGHKLHGYSDSWAVEVSGGEEKARELAAKHGFTFKGQVGNLRDMYHFELPGNGGQHSPHKTQALEAEDLVNYVEQQHYKQMSKKRPY